MGPSLGSSIDCLNSASSAAECLLFNKYVKNTLSKMGNGGAILKLLLGSTSYFVRVKDETIIPSNGVL